MHSSSRELYRDVGLVGLAAFVAVVLFMAALGTPAAADSAPGSLPSVASGTAGTTDAQSDVPASADAPAWAAGPSDASAGDATGVARSATPAHDHGSATADSTGRAHAADATTSASRPSSSPRTTAHAHGDGHGDARAGDTAASDGAETEHDHGDGHGDGDTAHDHGDGTEGDNGGHDHGGAGADDHGDHGGHGDMEVGHADHYAGCADDHPGTVALVEASRSRVSTMNVATMIAEGYIPYFDAMVPGNAATEGIGHWLNPRYIDDGNMLDPNQPESLLTDEFHRPLGVMYIEDAGTTAPPVYVNPDGTACSPWHPHLDLPARFSWWFYRQVYDGAAYNEGDAMIPEETPAMMHLWIVDNPAGVYAAHDYPPASSRESLPPPLPIPGGTLPAPLGGVESDLREDNPVGSDATCPHCPTGDGDGEG